MKTYLLKSYVCRVFPEALTANVQAVLPDESVPVWARSAKTKVLDLNNMKDRTTWASTHFRSLLCQTQKRSNLIKCIFSYQDLDPWPYLRGWEYQIFWKPMLLAQRRSRKRLTLVFEVRSTISYQHCQQANAKLPCLKNA